MVKYALYVFVLLYITVHVLYNHVCMYGFVRNYSTPNPMVSHCLHYLSIGTRGVYISFSDTSICIGWYTYPSEKYSQLNGKIKFMFQVPNHQSGIICCDSQYITGPPPLDEHRQEPGCEVVLLVCL